uniref:Mucin-5AC n=1 Tax=Salvator merianae TaxID=96440 RepID=A0A8D0C749_SALMN
KTFDGDIYNFPGTCNYVFASHCKSTYEDFNIQIRRSVIHNVTIISHIIMKIDGMAIELTTNSITVNGEPVQLPFSHLGVFVQRIPGYLRISSKIGLVLMWNQDDALLLELNEKYANQTCGLCGDFNGISTYNEFVSHDIKLNPLQFGNMQKMDGPTEQCQDPTPTVMNNCSQEFMSICQTVLTSEAFLGCNSLVEVEDYIDACIKDLCTCDSSVAESCICNTFAEYSRQCAHAGGQPQEWRTADLCAKTCPFNMQHRECGSPCADTCTNSERSQLCEDHCIDGCFCPSGTVYDDINNSGCIPIEDCSCTYSGSTYSPGASFASKCTSCTCTGGQWACVSLSCPGICSIEGGSHISTFDEKRYSFFGDCSYVLTKLCGSNAFTVLGEIRKCGLTDTETCLKGIAISISGGQTVIVVKSTGLVYVNMILTQLPFSASNVTIFRPSSFFIVAETNLGLQLEIQLVPIMQVFVRLDPTHKGQTCGLCGNFNSAQTDDFKAISGVVEGTSAAFANTWKTQADCPNIKNIFENPCTLSIENEKYASHWCGLLTDSNGPFQKCHTVVDPKLYHTDCMFDTCNCERSEDCLCAALSSYVRACASKGVLLSGWRTSICTKYQTCPKSLAYRYIIDSCQPTCRSLSEPDVTCNIKFTAVDGCTCEEGTYMDDNGKCVPAASCPCYYKGSPIPSGDVVREDGLICTCTQGRLQCIGEVKPVPVCDAPMIYFDCNNATVGTAGAECQKSCQTLDMGCYSTQCTSGCVCPHDLVSDGKGGCIAPDECPCIHNEVMYKPGESIRVKCNTCTCNKRKWECSNEPCMATCSVYGDGHYITFDGKRYSFNGDCEYTLVQDHCGKNGTSAGTFRVITENIPCGTIGTTCSKAIKVFLGNYELILADEKFEIIQRFLGEDEVPFKVRYMGIYMVIDTTVGLVLMWDKKTSIFIKLNKEFQGQVCGLCGNYDGNDMNDFTTRTLSVVGDALEFGNSWKVSPNCPDLPRIKDPCTANPYRSSWAQKQCSIINSPVFASCHSQVEPTKYYEACISDACACDTGGDCECFCTAVAAYAQACDEAGVCVAWRSPSICPLFCDYYNPQGECEWHYKPCGVPCMKTCRNPTGKCLHELQGLEGCYPNCPAEKPYFDEDDMECVSIEYCGCFDSKGKHYKPGQKMPSEDNCHSCFKPGDVVYNTTDGIGGCITAICDRNGTIERNIFPCQTTAIPTTVTTFAFSSTTSPVTTTSGTIINVPVTSSVCVQEVCHWSPWYDGRKPGSGSDDGDFETFDNLRAEGYKICKTPKAVECRAENFPHTPLSELDQNVECSKTVGLLCYNKDHYPTSCHNYQIRILCCSFEPCGITTASTPESPTVSTAPTTTPVPITTFTTTFTSTSTVTETTSIITTAPETTSSSSATTVLSTTETTRPSTEIPGQTTCKYTCKWTEWYDVHFPTLDNKGDFETYDIIRSAGKYICQKPEKIECRAEKFPEKSIDEIGQIVQCNVSYGFVCRNEDQSGILQMCFNYQIKVYCCDTVCLTTTPETPSTTTVTTIVTSPTPEATSTSVVTTQTKPTTTKTFTVPETTTVTKASTTTKSTTLATTAETTTLSTTKFTGTPIKETTSHIITKGTTTGLTTSRKTTIRKTPTPVTTPMSTTVTTTPITEKPVETTTISTSVPSTTEHCTKEVCEWSQWYDVSYPGSAPNDGDFDTFKNIRAKGYKVCKAPRNVECRAERYPDTPLSELEQKVNCSKTEGLICYNKDQLPPICYNYEIKIECCKQIIVPCPKTIITQIQTTTEPSKAPQKTTTPKLATTTSAITTTTKETTCAPVCQWSEWFDIDFPSPGPNGGDIETYNNIRAAGGNICRKPEHIQCRAENHPDLTIEQVGQAVECNVKTGLVCNNNKQVGKFKMCYNYEVRVLCCEPPPHCVTTATPKTTTTKPVPTTTTTVITTTLRPVSTTTVPETTTTEKCRAENHPDLSIEQVGQVAECNVKFGFVCKNNEQVGKFKLCFNYQIRVLCCEPTPHCLTTTAPTTTTTKPTPPVPSTTPVVITTSPITRETTTHPSLRTSTTPCFSFIVVILFFFLGETIYNKTDSDGCHFSAICSYSCSIERSKGPCITTTPKPTPTAIVSTTPASTTTPVTTEQPGCPDAKPPRETGEQWTSNCTISTCEGNNRIAISRVKCPPVQKLTCANGYPPVKVFSEDGCCYHYECECVCSGWGDPHYITFDGTYYTFLDNCTYVLVQQIIPKYDNFRVLIDNYYCDAEDKLSCPHSIIIYYKFAVIVLTRQLFEGVEVNKIYFNNKTVAPGFERDGIFIFTIGINMVVEIPEIGARITFSGLIFSIKLPYSKFGNNTEGQCGTCTNDKKDECRMPTGEITSCPHMAPAWRVHDEKKEYCFGPPPTSSPTPTPPGPCHPTPVCEMILSDVFSECHKIIPPEPFHKGCVFDACHINNTTYQCSGLQIYAALCADKGVCIDWRAKTNGSCPFSCPSDKVYDPCGPINVPTCDPGATWVSNCQECTCDRSTLSVQCKQKPCPAISPVHCPFEGFVPVLVTTPEDKCCPQYKCVCNTTFCPKSIEKCPLGYNLEQEKLEGDCCINATCGKNGSPGAIVPKGPCETCRCSAEEDPETKSNKVECVSEQCSKTCPAGQDYKEVPGKCCGDCVPVACVLKLGISDVHVIKPGETWHEQGDNCTTYECDVVEGQYITVTIKRPCHAFDETCPPASAMDHACTCCQESKTSTRQVTLRCPDDSTIEHSYIYVEECDCVGNQGTLFSSTLGNNTGSGSGSWHTTEKSLAGNTLRLGLKGIKRLLFSFGN